ncbi:MAG: hypothetical protein NTY34_00770, partial [Candidatus Omnitrophica bacterium]|nr:hypothetical protein [Candidatus Omnitrophota bacterium]
LTLYGKDVEPLNAVVEDILVKRLLTDKEGEALSSDAIEDNLKGLESYRNLSMKQQELLKYIFTDLYISGEHKDGIKKSASYAGGTKAGVPALFDSEKQEELGATIWSAMNSKGGEYIHIIVKPEEETGKVGIRVLRFKDGKKISKGAEEKKVVETFINSIKKFSLLNERLSDGQKILIPPGMGELYVVISLPPEAPNAIYDGFRDVLELLPDGSLRVDDEAIQHAFLADKDPLKRMLIIPRKLIDNEAALISAMARIGFAGDLTGSVRAVRILEQLKKYLYRHGSSSPEAYEATEAVIDRQIEILKAELGETLSAELLDNDRHDDAVPPAGIESRLLRPLIDYNMRAGRFGRLIAALGGLEEVFYSGVFIGGLSCIMHSPAIAVSIFAAAAALHFSRMIAALWYARILKNTKTHYWYAQNAARRLGRLNILKGISTKALRRASENNKFKDVRKTSIDELNKYGGRENIISGLIHGFNKFTLSALFAAVLGLAIDGLSAPGLYNSALAGLGVASAVYFRMRHSKEVFRLTGGVFKSGPPTKKDLNILTLAGIIFRSIYISLLIFLPYGNLNIFTALPAAILSHSLYNILTPWVLGTVQERPDVKRSNFAWQNFVLDREKSVNGTTSLKIDYWHGPLRELKNAGGKERCEFEIAGVHGRWVPLIDEYDQIVVAHIRAKDDQTVLDDYFVFRLDPASENLLVDNELKELGLEGERLLYYAARGARPVPARIPLKASLKEELNPNMLIGFIKAAVGGARLLECYGRQLARTPKRWSTWALEPELEDPETLKAIAEPFLAPGHEESDALPLSFTRHKRAARLPDLVTFDSEGKFGLIAEFGFHGVTELYKKNVNGLWFMLKQGMHNKGPSLPGRAAFYTDDIATRGIKGNIGVISEFQNDILKKAASSLCERSDLIEKDVLSFLMRLQTIFDLMVDSYGKRGGEAPLPGTVYYMVGGALKLNTLGRIKLPVIAKFVLNKEDGKYVLSDNGIRILDQFDNLEDLLASSYSKLKEIEERQSEVMAPMMGNASAVPVSSPEVGGAMGKLFRDKGAKELIRKGIVAKEELGHVVFYDQHDNILYTKDGMEARVKLTGDILSPVSGLEIILIEENEHIRGFAERGKVYMSKVLLFRDIAIFHELRESYYSLHPRELPPKINAHTFLRGCGKKTRAMVSEAFNSGGLNPDFSFGELIYYLRIHLPIGGVNHAEMRLIEYNGRQGSTGIELVYGEQDRVFGALMNGNFTKELSLGPRYKTSQQEPVAMDAGDAAGVIANEPKTDPADPEKNSGGEEKLEAQPPELAAAAISFGQIMIRAMPSTQDAAPEAIKGRAVVLYADDILERAAAGDFAYTIRSTQVLDDSTIVIYGKNPVMAQILDGIIRKAAGDKKIDLVKIEAEELSGYNCYDEIKVAYPDEAKELEVVLRKFSSIPGIKNRNVFGVIKGMTNESSLEGIRKFASEVDLPVVSFEDDKGMYSFRNALST